MRARLPMLFALLLASGAAMAGDGIRLAPLSPAGVAALLRPPPHGERIIMLWSLDCVYCEPNMQALARLQRAHPRQVELVTVDTDNIARHRGSIEARLRAAGMQGYDAYAYAAAAPAQLNFLLDPQWGGELPRTLVIRANGPRTAVSGELSPAQIERLLP